MPDDRPPKPPEFALALQLMRMVESYLEGGGSPITAMVALLRAQESLVFMMSRAMREVEDE